MRNGISKVLPVIRMNESHEVTSEILFLEENPTEVMQ